MNFDKNFDFKSKEKNWYNKWESNQLFKSSESNENDPYSILMPPPNVTGMLHFGHVLNHTLQDLFIRRMRMQGKDVVWFPGMDHAGIATQTKVEQQLKQEGKTRYDLGREKFIERVWDWKNEYGGIILEQLKRLGVSCDWDRTLFTMDECASKAVEHSFIKLYDEGLIYKGKRIINWSPASQTALSDEEVEFKEVHEKLYTLKYFFEDGENYLKVATVRPETIYGDIAVAVNPNDKRFKKLIGQKVTVPLVGRKIEIIADDYADPEFGTGCVKITPAHDPNDFEIGQRHNLESINTINPDGTLNDLAGSYSGLDRFEARKKIIADLESNNLMEKIEDYTHNVGFSQRGGEPIEPYLSDQWFVKMKPLAEDALKIVQNGQINFYPNHWVKTYEHWMNNIKDWCISRQLWWGHRIPVYYTEDGQHTAARSEEEARKKLGIDRNVLLKQDEDVLDTWFSSWLWPMTTMGWFDDEGNIVPNNETMQRYLPTDLLVTGPDIIFFWVARMVMATNYFKQEIPFKNVYFTSLIRDGQGRKLSKSLGNSPDPLNVMDKYGADAVRFTILYLAPLGQDVRMEVDLEAQDIPSMEVGRNFANKVWNAGRFLKMKQEEFGDVEFNKNTYSKSLADKWIKSKLHKSINEINEYLNNFKVTEYSKTLYDFIWSDFCDWYIECLKIESYDNTEEQNQQKVAFGIEIFNEVLKLLHPVMPFITEELWHLLNNYSDGRSISLEQLIDSNENYDTTSIEKFEKLIALVDSSRSLRASIPSISAGQRMKINFNAEVEIESLISDNHKLMKELTKSSELMINNPLDEISIKSVTNFAEVNLYVGDAIDVDQEIERLEKEINRLEGQVNGISKKLSNKRFVSNAPEDVVNRERKKLKDMTNKIEQLNESLNSFK
ncbi:MAG: valine--tRNA ligase [Chlorobiota bacterium]